MSSFWLLSNSYPYTSFTKKWWALEYVWLRLFPSIAFPRMSIEPYVRRAHGLGSYQQFLDRYHQSQVGFEELWNARPRETKEDIEHFYQETDADIWRQAYLSTEHYEYKKKILHVYHLVRANVQHKKDPILDYGGGAGVMVQYLAAKGYTSVDIADIPSAHLDFVRAQMSGVLRNVITATGEEQYPSEEYAAIITLDCLEHTLHPLSIVQRLLAALKSGGLLVINFPKEDDFTHAHLEQAQVERDQVFALLAEACDVLVPQSAYRKK